MQFLVWSKQIGPAQNVLRLVGGQEKKWTNKIYRKGLGPSLNLGI